jgi:hypothetical protein
MGAGAEIGRIEAVVVARTGVEVVMGRTAAMVLLMISDASRIVMSLFMRNIIN